MAASYDDVEDAVAAFEAVKVVYDHVATSHAFDAAVVAKDESGEVRIEKKHEEPTRHGAAMGLGWGLAAGAVVALFPAVGIPRRARRRRRRGRGAGRGRRHASGGMDRDDLKALGEVLDQGDAGLIVVYHADMADRVTPACRGAKRWARRAPTSRWSSSRRTSGRR